jgi:hypothetical protein
VRAATVRGVAVAALPQADGGGSARPGSCGLFAGVEDLADLCALGAVALSGQPGMVEAGGPGWVRPGGEELIAHGEFGVGDLIGGSGGAKLAGEQLGRPGDRLCGQAARANRPSPILAACPLTCSRTYLVAALTATISGRAW